MSTRSHLRRFWFPTHNHLGVGVTAYTRAEAVALALSALQYLPGLSVDIDGVIEDVDVSTLDARHLPPNMGDCSRHGIWFPNLQSAEAGR